MDKKPTSPSFEENTPASVQQSRLAWQKLGWRIRSITPTSLARGLLVLGMLTFLTWLLIKSWANLLPFQIGVILAYIALPLVNRLDRIFPRGFVILLVILGEIILVVAFIFVMIPALAEQIRQLLTIFCPISSRFEPPCSGWSFHFAVYQLEFKFSSAKG